MSSPRNDEKSVPGGKISVSFHSGYKGEETPRAVFIEGREFPIEEVLERKRILNRASGRVFDLFVCRIAGKKVNIKADPSGAWEMSPPPVLSSLEKEQSPPGS
ncbi:MAG: hypothetical protein JXO51_05370 [Candidatus Aminicenantes bacterium]|nr:hypothetical protein [Candidatus Aminicenantes bacterium]